MPDFDLILRGGMLVTSAGVTETDLAIGDGKIVEVGAQLRGHAREEIVATGLHIFPGVIDSHVHFNEPGRTEWEGIESGSRALAAGGGTVFFDMPLNAHPPTLDRESFELKAAAAARKSYADFALWGGLVPHNLDRLAELGACGVVGFKAFMSDSGIDDFSRVDDATLREGMKRAAALQLPVAVHAESEMMTRRLAQESLASGRDSIRDYLDSRPVAAELEAIDRAVNLAAETSCALHVVHVSSGEGVRAIAAAKSRGVNVTCETCPHYLVLNAADVEAIGALAKCAPPLRPVAIQDALWHELLAGRVDTIGSDHSPAPPDQKRDVNFFRVWGGISSVQHTLPLLLTAAAERGAPLPLLTRMLSSAVAQRFGFSKSKGTATVGCDADLALVNLGQPFEVQAAELFYRHRQTPYAGRRLRGQVVRTLLRGRTVFHDGNCVAPPAGRLIKPQR